MTLHRDEKSSIDLEPQEIHHRFVVYSNLRHADMGLHCAKCSERATKRCKACLISSANYRSKECQWLDWPEHKFECGSKSPSELDTADLLVRAVYRRHIPIDMDTLKDYG